MEVDLTPTKRIKVLGLDERPLEDIAWCCVSMDVSKLFWIDGYLLCMETYEKAFEHEVETGIFPINQICYAKYPCYSRLYDVGRGVQISIVKVSGMRLFEAIVEKIRNLEKAEK
ncbi:MAG: hypothetical protein QXI39_03030 [Candidatus Bathyarchaeia archaeon]